MKHQGIQVNKNTFEFLKRFKKQLSFQLMLIPALIFATVFSYLPLFGIIIAFQEFSYRKGIFGSTWVGLKYFKSFFNDPALAGVIINTLALSVLTILLAFPIPILFALLLNDIKNMSFKRIVQTISYFPHFISWVIVAVIAITFLSPSEGIINYIFVKSGIFKKPIFFLGHAEYFWWIAIFTNIWKETGWNAIIYMAAMSGIDPSLYESAKIDGAGKLRSIWYITLPSIKGTISILFILTLSFIPFTGFEQAMLLGNPLNYDKSNVLSYYVYKLGIMTGDYSYSTAISLVLSAVSCTIMIIGNFISKKFSGAGIIQ